MTNKHYFNLLSKLEIQEKLISIKEDKMKMQRGRNTTVTVSLPLDYLVRIDKECEKKDVNRSYIIRQALKQYFKIKD